MRPATHVPKGLKSRIRPGSGTELESTKKAEYFCDLALLQNYGKLNKRAVIIRIVETNIRNLAAHEIVSVTKATMSNMTGFTGEEIMTMIKELFPHTGIMVKREYWNSYDQMNEMILEKMSLES